jgi:hypothetical protein
MESVDRFSIREGCADPHNILLFQKMTKQLINKIWNCIYQLYLFDSKNNNNFTGFNHRLDSDFTIKKRLYYDIWAYFLAFQIDQRPYSIEEVDEEIKKAVNAKWYRIYELVEFIIEREMKNSLTDNFIIKLNQILEEEHSAYRFSNQIFTSIINENEIESVSNALNTFFSPSQEFIKKAFIEFSNLKNPDYPNTIKDSLCAVESLCKIIANNGAKTLPDTLPILKNEANIELHPSLAKSLDSLYGYRNVKSGVSHGGTVQSNEGFEEAKFFLITCSEWINYLTEKAIKKGIELEKK